MSDQPNTFTIDSTKEGEWLRVVRALGGPDGHLRPRALLES